MECAAPRARRIPGPHVPFTPCAPARRRQAPTGANKLRLQLAAAVDHHRAHSWGPPTTPLGRAGSGRVLAQSLATSRRIDVMRERGMAPRSHVTTRVKINETRKRNSHSLCSVLLPLIEFERKAGKMATRGMRGRHVGTWIFFPLLLFYALL